jgi:hypothetical protein
VALGAGHWLRVWLRRRGRVVARLVANLAIAGWRFGGAWIVILGFLTGWAMLGTLPSTIDFGGTAPLLGMAVLAALLDSFAEEVMYRAAPLSQLAPAIGPGHAVLLLAVWLGLGTFTAAFPRGGWHRHTGAIALLFGRAMIGTGGLAWPWALHFTADLIIFTAIGLTANALPA